MGRQIRMVPAGWEHPRYTKDNAQYRHHVGAYMPMHDQHFDERFEEWLADFDRIRGGDLSDIERECYPRGLADWLADEGTPPDPAYYRHYKDEEATWFQVFENVSEGTPVTPPFATREELVEYLISKGDFWQQKRWAENNTFMQPTPPGYSREAAEAFVMRDGDERHQTRLLAKRRVEIHGALRSTLCLHPDGSDPVVHHRQFMVAMAMPTAGNVSVTRGLRR